MKEKNADKLREALNRLPQHDAPADAWAGITEGLSPTLADKLPTYQPPAGVWNSLSRELEAKPALTAVQRRLPVRALLGAAAAIALVLTVSLGLISGLQHQQSVTLVYSQEAAPAQSIHDLTADEESFERARAEIAARNEPALNELGHELAELDEAKEEIKAVLVAYGEDPSVIRQLAEIERDRSDIYRRIIEL